MLEVLLPFINDNCSDIIADVSVIDTSVFPEHKNIIFGFKGKVTISGRQVEVSCGFDQRFPMSKPMFYLESWDALGFIPHIERDGFICYMHDEGLLLDVDNPQGILRFCLERAIDTLSNGYSGTNRNDFINEFESYWAQQENSRQVISLLPETDRIESIQVWIGENDKSPYLALPKSAGEMDKYIKAMKADGLIKTGKKHHGVFIPLKSSTMLYPPSYNEQWGMKQWKEIIRFNITGSNKTTLKELLKSRKLSKDSREFIVLSIPQVNGNRAYVGFVMEGFTVRKEAGRKQSTNKAQGRKRKHVKKVFRHPLLEVQCDFKIVPLTIERHNQKFMVSRTGGKVGLINKNIAVVGVGAVGSRVVMELIRAGITNLTLIDKQCLEVENVYRHELGVNRLYAYIEQSHKLIPHYKVVSLANEINEKYPLVNVTTKPDDVYNILNEDQKYFEKFDLVIVATGDVTLELSINRLLRQLTAPPVTIFTWVEPLGIGGHVISTLNNRESGCLECLFFTPGNSELLENRASFAGPNQFFGKTVSGCGSVFTPYGSMDSMQTAILTTRLAIAILTGRECDNPLLSWKGDQTDFIEAGYSLSNRYNMSNEELYKMRYGYKSVQCPTCSKDMVVT